MLYVLSGVIELNIPPSGYYGSMQAYVFDRTGTKVAIVTDVQNYETQIVAAGAELLGDEECKELAEQPFPYWRKKKYECAYPTIPHDTDIRFLQSSEIDDQTRRSSIRKVSEAKSSVPLAMDLGG